MRWKKALNNQNLDKNRESIKLFKVFWNQVSSWITSGKSLHIERLFYHFYCHIMLTSDAYKVFTKTKNISKWLLTINMPWMMIETIFFNLDTYISTSKWHIVNHTNLIYILMITRKRYCCLLGGRSLDYSRCQITLNASETPSTVKEVKAISIFPRGAITLKST